MNKIGNILENLNEYQRKAVLDNNKCILVNAQVGSGKTTVLTTKVIYLHAQYNIPFEDMVVLTFTNKAAEEIKKRIQGMNLAATDHNMDWFGTFHSVAMKLLKNKLPLEEIGFSSSFSVIDPDEELELANRLIVSENLKISYKNKLEKRLEEYRKGNSQYGIMKNADDIEKLAQRIEEEKKNENKMNFDDLLNYSSFLLAESSFKPKWVIIDEFQDCDELQMNFIRNLVKDETNIFIVGDPNQIIYTWRGSKKNIFEQFKNEFNACELTLPLNYRSSATILDAAKIFLDKNTELEGIKDQGTKIKVSNHYNSFLEANYIADKIKSLNQSGIEFKDIAILYRLQRQSKNLENVFEKENIPFVVSEKRTVKDIPVLQWFIKLLKASSNTNDRSDIISVFTNKNFGYGMTLKNAGRIINHETENELFGKITGFSDWVKDKNSALMIYDYFEIDRYINPTSSHFSENKDLIMKFLRRMDIFLSDNKSDFPAAINNFLNSVTLWGIDETQDAVENDHNKVRLMTLHASKGLEFKYVFIIGLNNGLIPLHISGKEEEMEEEKRLFFVGITRSVDHLELLWYTKPDDQRVMPFKSSYLNMIPQNLLLQDDENSNNSDLKELHKLLNRQKENKEINIENIPGSVKIYTEEIKKRKVKHSKYGIGEIEHEDDDTLTVKFPEYGDKTFSKDFNPLEFID